MAKITKKIRKIILKTYHPKVTVFMSRELLALTGETQYTPSDTVKKVRDGSGHSVARNYYNMRLDKKGFIIGEFYRKGWLMRIKETDLKTGKFIAVSVLGRGRDIISDNSIVLPRGYKIK